MNIYMGVPEMDELWRGLRKDVESGQANAERMRLFKRLRKALILLKENPRHPGLHTHKIEELSRRTGVEVWQSYLQNNTPSAGRLFWAYGPGKDSITILGLEPHPNDRGAYQRIRLSKMGDAT